MADAPAASAEDQALGARRQLAAIAADIPGARTSYEALLYIPGSDELLHTVQWWGTKWRLRDVDETIDGERRYRLYDDFGEVLALVWPKVAAEVTPLAVRDALRAPHWSDDTTLTDEERAAMERKRRTGSDIPFHLSDRAAFLRRQASPSARCLVSGRTTSP